MKFKRGGVLTWQNTARSAKKAFRPGTKSAIPTENQTVSGRPTFKEFALWKKALPLANTFARAASVPAKLKDTYKNLLFYNKQRLKYLTQK